MFDWVIGGLGSLFGFVGDAAGSVAGWAWDKVITGIYRWLANGLALLIEWVWSVLDSATTPRVTEAWFRNGLAARVGLIGLAVTIAMMLLSAAQAALAGRPEQIGDVLKESMKAIVASAFTITVIDVLIGVTDEASTMIWQVGRPDLVRMIEGMVAVATVTGPLATTFVGPLALLFGFIGLIGLVVSLLMRSALIYVVAAMAPLVWSLGVLPSFRGSSRKLVHLAVSLVLSKLAIVITLVVAVKLIAHPVGAGTGSVINDAASAVGTLMAGFVCFLVAAVTPMVLYRLMPTIEGAMVGSGIASGWTRGATTAAHTGLMVKSFGASAGASAATRAIAGQRGAAGQAAAPTRAAPAGGSGASARSPAGSGTAVNRSGTAPAASSSGGAPTGGAPAPPNGGSSTGPSRPVGQPASADTTNDEDAPVEPKAAES
jgi:type IV secretion system protein TrbL